MNKINLGWQRFAIAIFFIFIHFSNLFSHERVDTIPTDIYLVISSFNPDTKRSTDFISSLDKSLKKAYGNKEYHLLIEDLGAKNFSEEAHKWKGVVKSVLDKYSSKNVKAIFTIGQEAWAALSLQDDLCRSYPVLGFYISSNGIILPDSKVGVDWEAEWTNLVREGRSKSCAGGFVSVYNPVINLDLILKFFPYTKNIALITDNTYGGVSIKTHFKRYQNQFSHLNFKYLDARIYSYEEIQSKIESLDSLSAIIIGTWRVNREGQYFFGNSLEELLKNTNLPIFSLTGAGMNRVAIGGYFPDYKIDDSIFDLTIKRIFDFYGGEKDSIRFIANKSLYQFDNELLHKYNIDKTLLPKDSNIHSKEDTMASTYKQYLVLALIVITILLIFLVVMYILYSRNKTLNYRLETTNRELTFAKDKAEESDRLKSAFLANMSHEIRTPLNAIVGFSNLLSDDDYSKDEKKKMSNVITKNSELLLTLITDILDLSRLERDVLNFVYKEISLSTLCEEVFSTTVHLKKEDIDYSIEKGCPDTIITTDIHRISQVMINLLTNANKFTDYGSITLKYQLIPSAIAKSNAYIQNINKYLTTNDSIVSYDSDTYPGTDSGKTTDISNINFLDFNDTNLNREDYMILFSVTDTGIGIEKEMHSKIFERFGKIHHFKQGAGLGLAISKQIVTKLGGNIWIDPSYYTGARFYFTHPL